MKRLSIIFIISAIVFFNAYSICWAQKSDSPNSHLWAKAPSIENKETQSFIEGKINELRAVIGRSEVLDIETGPTDRVVFGRTVLLYDVNTEEEVTYQLLGPDDADIDTGSISIHSPVGRAILGHSVGDKLSVTIPRGDRHFEVIDIARSEVE